jgi:TPP-dependent indolepyruvate ferredoxin oxidoreductase alpha subunit
VSLSTSARTYAHHLSQRERVWAALAPWLATRWVGWGLESDRRLHLAVIVAAHLGEPVAAQARARGLPGLRLRSEHPLPVDALVALAERCQELVVLEECTPTLEHEIAARIHAAGLSTPVRGRRSFGDTRPVGRLEGAVLDELFDAALRRCPPGMRCRQARPSAPGAPALTELLADLPAALLRADRELDARSPASGFPSSDPRRALFAALRELADGPVFVAADPGVTGVLALADHGCDVKMHMGGAVPIAAGWSRARPEGLALAVVGDTNLPHSEWLGLLDALDHGDDVLVIVANNGASEMTQRIVTPRLSPERALASLEAAGLPCLRARASTSPDDPWHQRLREVAVRSGPRLLWLEL